MSKYIIEGGLKLEGDLNVYGAKNSILPILASTILPQEEVTIENCPYISDVHYAMEILKYMGVNIKREGDVITVNTSGVTHSDIPAKLMSKMRSSVIFLGAILAKCGHTKITLPGGCDLGLRPIDLHLQAFSKMGVSMNENKGYLECFVNGKLKGANISLAFPSVGATENIMIAASTAQGQTIITNAAREPEIVCLANFLNSCGALIYGAGSGEIVINGVEKLKGAHHKIMPDRIVVTTYMAAAALTGGKLVIKNIAPAHISMIVSLFEEMGCYVKLYNNTLYIKGTNALKSIPIIKTMPYPGFPTDCQALFMAVSSISEGTTMFVENIFENRYKHAHELAKMGANIIIEGKVCVVNGVKKLTPAIISATDLRAGAALTLAALNANGYSEISNVHFIERGYADLDKCLNSVGAKIIKVN